MVKLHASSHSDDHVSVASGPLSGLALICIVIAVLGIKMKWFKKRLVFNADHSDTGGDIADGTSSAAIQMRGYRSLPSAEPQIVRAVFRTGPENDDYVEDGIDVRPVAPLPPIRIHRLNSPFSRPQSISPAITTEIKAPERHNSSTDRANAGSMQGAQGAESITVLHSQTDDASASSVSLSGSEKKEQPSNMNPAVIGSVSVDISPSEMRQEILFTSVEDVRNIDSDVTAKDSGNSVAKQLVNDPPPYELSVSTPDLSLPPLAASPSVSISTPDLTTPAEKPMPRVHQSIFSFLSRRSTKQSATTPAKNPTKTIRLLKGEAAPQHNDKTDNTTLSPEQTAQMAQTNVTRTLPTILHTNETNNLQKIKSPTVVKTVRFVTSETSDDEEESNNNNKGEATALRSPPPPPQPLKRTILNVAAAQSDKEVANKMDDPWAALDLHRQHNDAMQRNRFLAAERMPTSQSAAQPIPPKRRIRDPTLAKMTTNDANVTPPHPAMAILHQRPKTLREMQREQRERHANNAAPHFAVVVQPSDTDA